MRKVTKQLNVSIIYYIVVLIKLTTILIEKYYFNEPDSQLYHKMFLNADSEYINDSSGILYSSDLEKTGQNINYLYSSREPMTQERHTEKYSHWILYYHDTGQDNWNMFIRNLW
jgi:hypothetical protein